MNQKDANHAKFTKQIGVYIIYGVSGSEDLIRLVAKRNTAMVAGTIPNNKPKPE
ncbi:MAG: hypothetical protein MK078_15445 [Crocinitomicaceae bacterium]|nr:hypothetical protein [Crocinitomicaceae bacterium]